MLRLRLMLAHRVSGLGLWVMHLFWFLEDFESLILLLWMAQQIFKVFPTLGSP